MGETERERVIRKMGSSHVGTNTNQVRASFSGYADICRPGPGVYTGGDKTPFSVVPQRRSREKQRVTTVQTPLVQEDDEQDDEYTPAAKVSQRSFLSRHSLAIGITTLSMVVAYIFYSGFVVPTVTKLHNQWNYGSSGVSEVVIGTDNFVSFLYHGQAVIVDYKVTDGQLSGKGTTYIVPAVLTDHPSGLPVTVESFDSHGDMLVKISGVTQEFILYAKSDGNYSWAAPKVN